MALQSMTALASITLQEATASVSFSGIPQNYRDLVLVGSVKHTTSNGGYIAYRLNGDTGINYPMVYMLGNGSTTASAAISSDAFGRFGNAGTSNFESTIFNIFDYSATDKHKTTLSRTNIVSLYTVAYATRWASTSAVTSIQLFPDSGQFASGSTFNLYGRIA